MCHPGAIQPIVTEFEQEIIRRVYCVEFDKMEDNSLEELLAEVQALSVKHNWSDSVKDFKKHNNPEEDTVLGISWSDDDNDLAVAPEDHYGNSLAAQTNGKYSGKDGLTNCSAKGEHELFKSLANHVTIRRRPRQNHSFMSEYSANKSGNGKEENMVNVKRTLSFGDCFNPLLNGVTIQQCTKSLQHDSCSDELSNMPTNYRIDKAITQYPSKSSKQEKQTEMCLSQDVKFLSCVLSNDETNHGVSLIEQKASTIPGVDRASAVMVKNVSHGCFMGVSVSNIFKKADAALAETQENTWKKPKETVPSANYVKGNQEILYDESDKGNAKTIDHTSSSKTKDKGTIDLNGMIAHLSSETDSDYGSVWKRQNEFVEDSESSFEKNQYNKHPVPLSNKGIYTVDLTCSAEKKTGGKLTDVVTGNSNSAFKKTPRAVQRSVTDSGSSDDDFEAFLADMRKPKPSKTTQSTPSLKTFIVDDWITDSSDEEELPSFLNTKSSPLNIKMMSSERIKIPKLKRTPLRETTSDNTPLKSSSINTCIEKVVTPYTKTPRKFWQKSREQLVKELFLCYNETVFDNKLPIDMPVTWNKQMTKTAGFCYYIGSQTSKKCRIELSDKVVDSCERIRDTLIHELCHAATWVIDGIKAGHGPHWKRWALKAKSVHSNLPPISRCHSYEINYKFTYKCLKCHHRFGRHSKSINIETARCPYCHSRLELLPRMNKDGTPAKPRAPSKFSLFVKANYGKIKACASGSSHQEIMKELSKRFAEASLNKDDISSVKV